MKRFVGALTLTLAIFVARQAGAADCPDHCTEDRIDYFAHVECNGPEAIDHNVCNRMVWLLMREMERRKIPCEHPGVWLDNQSALARVNCVAGGEPPNWTLISTAYGVGVIPSPNGPRVATFGQITDNAMWSQWLTKARLGPVLAAASGGSPTDEELNPYQHMLTTMGPVLMESIQSVGHVCDKIDAIALNNALAVKYYHVTCNGGLRYTVGISPTRTIVWPGDLSGY